MARSMTERSAGRTLWLQLLALFVCALLPQLSSFGYGFVDYDDGPGIVDLPLIRSLSLPRIFALEVQPWLPEYMPLKNLSYALDYACFGLWAPGFRIQQQLWYTLTVWFLFLWLRGLLTAPGLREQLRATPAQAQGVALLTAALFALHPVHVESVTWISGRKDVLSGALCLAALCCGAQRTRRGALACVGLCALALLAKPTAVVLPALLVLGDWLGSPRSLRQRAPLYAALLALCAGFTLLYWQLARDYTGVDPQLEAALFQGPGWLRWGQQLRLFLELCFLPEGLAPRIPAQLDPQLLSAGALSGLALAALSLALWAWLLARRHVLALALGLFLIPLAPVVISAPWGQYVAGRYLFLAVAGPLLALVCAGFACMQWRPQLAWAAWAACGLLALRLGVGALDYARNFEDSVALWTGAIAAYPDATENHVHAGQAAVRAGRLPLAAAIYEACLQVDAGEPVCNAGLAALLAPTQPERAEALLRRALPRDRLGNAHAALALYLAKRGDPAQALALFEGYLQGRALTPDQLNTYAHLAVLASQPHKAWQAALDAARMHAARFPAAPPAGDALLEAAQARGDPRFTQRVQTILTRCARMDCVAEALAERASAL